MAGSGVRLDDVPGFFSASYEEARATFLEACATKEFSVESHRNTTVMGVNGEGLYTDVVRIGPDDTERLVVIMSGTHGIEGYCGSGCQSALIHDGAFDDLPRGTGVVLAHALNPFGFSYQRRVNESNIDLNRNFVDHAANAYPDSSAYSAIHDLIAPADYGERPQEWDAAVLAWIGEHGMDSFRQAVSGGQYVHPDGLFYGGTLPSWSNSMFRKLAQTYMQAPAQVRLIDIHTGLGPYGHGEKLGLGDGSAVRRAQAIWGDDVTDLGSGTSVSAAVSGDTGSAFFTEVPGSVEAAGIGLEFGTQDPVSVLTALRFDNWLHMHTDPTGDRAVPIKQLMRDAFYPDDAAWKKTVFEQTRQAVQQALS